MSITPTLRCPACGGELWRRKRCDTESCDRYQEAIDDPTVDPGEVLTVGDLREALSDVDDDALLRVSCSGAWNWVFTIDRDRLERGDAEVVELSEHREPVWNVAAARLPSDEADGD